VVSRRDLPARAVARGLGQFSISLHRHGSGDAALCVYLYILFYSAFFLIPFYILSAWSRSRLGTHADETIGDRLFLSGWFAATFFLFADSIMEFFRHLPTDDWRALLVIVWVLATIGAIFSFTNFRRQLGASRCPGANRPLEFNKRS